NALEHFRALGIHKLRFQAVPPPSSRRREAPSIGDGSVMSWANRDLQRIERRVEEAYQRVVRCRRLIQRLQADGRAPPLSAAQGLVISLQKNLDELRAHERIIIGEMARETAAEARWRWR